MRTTATRVSFIIVLMIFTFGVSGCSSLEVVPLQKGGLFDDGGGIKVYEPMPYLLVTQGAADAGSGKQASKPPTTSPSASIEGQVNVQVTVNSSSSTTQPASGPKAEDKPPQYQYQIIYLPNFSDGFRIKFPPTLGTSEASLKLSSGWQLTDLNAKGDTKAAETITALGNAIPSIAKALVPLFDAKSKTVKPAYIGPGLYRFVFDTKTGQFIALAPLYQLGGGNTAAQLDELLKSSDPTTTSQKVDEAFPPETFQSK